MRTVLKLRILLLPNMALRRLGWIFVQFTLRILRRHLKKMRIGG